MTAKNKIRAIAFYLPQYHPIPENNEWWGKGFTEWTNVTKAKPLFKNHYQPILPSDLGYYDLRLPETRKAQAEMARLHGIEGFCYWHYWFGNGKRVLERPFNEVLKSGDPDFPFCLGWANESWTGIWHGNPKKILAEQLYPGREDYINHFNYLFKAFSDKRYITVEGKPLFYIYSPDKIPDLIYFTDLFRELAQRSGLKGLYIVANSSDANWNPQENGCDAVNLTLLGDLYRHLPLSNNLIHKKYRQQLLKPKVGNLYRTIFKKPVNVYEYRDAIKHLTISGKKNYDCYPSVVPNWDNTARSNLHALILHNSTPELFAIHLNNALELVKNNNTEKKIIFIKSWNEWAEGNFLEPDQKHGNRYLQVLKKSIDQFNA